MATMPAPSDAWGERNAMDEKVRKAQAEADDDERAMVERHNSFRALGKDVEDAARRDAAEARLESALSQYGGDRTTREPKKDGPPCTMCGGTGKVKGWFNSQQECWKCKGPKS